MTDSEIRDAAVALLRQTTVGYGTWLYRCQNGYQGKPYDGATTAWGRALALLATIGVTPVPDPVPVPVPGGSGMVVPPVPATATRLTTNAEFLAAVRAPAAGGKYDCRSIPGGLTSYVWIDGKAPASAPAEFWLPEDRDLVVSVPKPSNWPNEVFNAIETPGAQNLRFYNLGFASRYGSGLVLRGGRPTECVGMWFLGLRCHDVSGVGIGWHGNSGPVRDFVITGDVTRWARDIVVDPHTTDGSGLHGVYGGASGAPQEDTGWILDLNIHDCEWGGGFQWTRQGFGRAWIRATNLLYDPPVGADGTGGNVLQPFFGNSHDITIVEATGDHVRKMLNQSGGGNGGTLTVQKGRGTNVRSSAAYDRQPATTLVDCLPTTFGEPLLTVERPAWDNGEWMRGKHINPDESLAAR